MWSALIGILMGLSLIGLGLPGNVIVLRARVGMRKGRMESWSDFLFCSLSVGCVSDSSSFSWGGSGIGLWECGARAFPNISGSFQLMRYSGGFRWLWMIGR